MQFQSTSFWTCRGTKLAIKVVTLMYNGHKCHLKLVYFWAKTKSFSASSHLIFFKIKTNSDFSIFEQIRHMFGISAVVYYKCNCCNGHFSPYNTGKKSEMSTSSGMKQLIRDIPYLDT